MAGKYGPASVVIQIDDGPGGTLRNITAYVQSIGGIKIEQINEETSPFGQAYNSNTPIGKQNVPDIVLEGLFDTTATVGPHVVLGDPDDDPNGATRSFSFTAGDSKTFTMECRLADYEVRAEKGTLSRFTATIKQAGLGAWP